MNKKYSIVTFLVSLSLGAFESYRDSDRVSSGDKLTVVLAYYTPDKKDKEAKEQVRKLKKAFESFTRDRHHRKIGVRFMTVNLSENASFKNNYLSDTQSMAPQLLFFKRGDLLEEETHEISDADDLSAYLNKALSNSRSEIRKIIKELEEDYDEKQDELDRIRAANAYSMMYPSGWDYYNGYYNPYYPYSYRSYGPVFGMGFSFYGGCRNR